jgi:hypothetical protein
MWPVYKGVYGKGFSKDNQETKYLRTIFLAGSPLAEKDGTKYPNSLEGKTEQKNIYLEWGNQVKDYVIKDLGMEKNGLKI